MRYCEKNAVLSSALLIVTIKLFCDKGLDCYDWKLTSVTCVFKEGPRDQDSMNEWKCSDLKCVRKPTRSWLSLTHHAEQSKIIRWSESPWNQSGRKGKGLWRKNSNRLVSLTQRTGKLLDFFHKRQCNKALQS